MNGNKITCIKITPKNGNIKITPDPSWSKAKK